MLFVLSCGDEFTKGFAPDDNRIVWADIHTFGDSQQTSTKGFDIPDLNRVGLDWLEFVFMFNKAVGQVKLVIRSTDETMPLCIKIMT